MAKTFFFYDLETSGINPRKARIMQFAGQRTDMDLSPIGKPINFLIKLSDDILPDPDAVLVTGITPQKSVTEGITEAEFCKIFKEDISSPDTIFVGFNSVRFDDEFMRFLLYRNFCDSYEWQWKDACSRWDMLDVVRMTRALRPEGIKWPVDANGVCTNRLEYLTKANDLLHDSAHDALSDVKATIAVASMIKGKQPDLFDYMLKMRDKRAVKELVLGGKPFVYTSGKYPSEFEKTTIVSCLGEHPNRQGVLVYDLRHNPEPYLKMPPEKLVDIWQYNKDKDAERLPVKALLFNRCPAVAPLGVVDDASQKRLKIDMDSIHKHHKLLAKNKEFTGKLHEAIKMLESKRLEQTKIAVDEIDVDTQLYDGFIPDADKRLMASIHQAKPDEISEFGDKFTDPRLKKLVLLYKARNYKESLSPEEQIQWDEYKKRVFYAHGENSTIARFGRRLQQLGSNEKLSAEHRYLLEELSLYAESIIPADY